MPHNFQITVADEVNMTRTSAPVYISVTIQSVNDEPPRITQTSPKLTFVEERGPINIVDQGVLIVDLDNCPEHMTVAEVVVSLENPVPGEDQLIVAGEVLDNYTMTFTCDTMVDGSDCYEEFLRNITYNNTNEEPESYSQDRFIIIEVCTTI